MLLKPFTAYPILNGTIFLQELLRNGENVNQATILGTPLSVAVRMNNLKIVKILASHPTCNLMSR